MSGNRQTFRLWGPHPDSKPHRGQVPIWNARRRLFDRDDPLKIAFAACGVRWGKDRVITWTNLAGLISTFRRRMEEGTDLVPPVLSWIVAGTSTDYEQVFREYVAHTAGLPRYVNRASGQESIYLFPDRNNLDNSGIHLDFKSGWNPDRLVGSGIDSAHVTEAAKLPDESYEQLLGRLGSPGRIGVLLGNGQPTVNPSSWYREMFEDGKRGAPNMVFVNEPSWANPTMDDASLRTLALAKQKASPRSWAANFEARLLSAGGGLWPDLDAVCTHRQLERGDRSARYLKFFDPSGLGRDFDALAVFRIDGQHRDRPKQVNVYHWPKMEWEAKEPRLREIMAEYPGEFHFDGNGRISMKAALRRIAPPGEFVADMTWTNTKKNAMVDNFARVVSQHGIELLHPCASDAAAVQYQELQHFSEIRTAAGNVKYEAPAGKHDDLAMAVIPAVWAMENAQGADAGSVLLNLGVFG